MPSRRGLAREGGGTNGKWPRGGHPSAFDRRGPMGKIFRTSAHSGAPVPAWIQHQKTRDVRPDRHTTHSIVVEPNELSVEVVARPAGPRGPALSLLPGVVPPQEGLSPLRRQLTLTHQRLRERAARRGASPCVEAHARVCRWARHKTHESGGTSDTLSLRRWRASAAWECTRPRLCGQGSRA